ncbi:O-Antigen Polymerase family [Nautilia profundicola AmH]|uniref:O-Antigen Polymerase family n=1 Tax=Nautilia profundicola (strain ATCC BAA-1463 / DSM 18972 / AmH) TaxID=598659 RepID=B9L6P8_NAUPA|nr:O-antigen ligase family protein [Nautilia profundicola]ACM92955.1 O-Antigen Polymerase family [Nautilia profundicola AmH]
MLINTQQLKIDNKRNISFISIYSFILFILLKPNFDSIADRVIDILIFLQILFFLFIMNIKKIPQKGFFWIKINLFFLLAMLFAFLNGILQNINYIFRDAFEFYRPIFNIILFIFGMYLPKTYKNVFLKIALFVIIVQLVFIILQLLNPFDFIHSIVNYIYDMHKVSTGLLRVTGTYANPNTLGIVMNILFFYIFLYFLNKKKFKINLLYSIFFIHLIIVFLSSSRTSLLIALMVYIYIFFSNKKILFNYRSFILGIIVFLIILLYNQEIVNIIVNFKYIYELFKLEDLSHIRSIQLRLDYYQMMFEMIKENPFFGVGAAKNILRVGDNDYLFTLAQYGIIGFVIKYGGYIYLYYKLKKLLNFTNREYIWLIEGTMISIIILFIAGLTIDSFYNYSFLTIILINAGFSLSLYTKMEINCKSKTYA